MFCPYCGTLLDDDALSCTACNSPVTPVKESAPADAVAELQTVADQEPESGQETVTEEIIIEPEETPKPAKKASRRVRILLTSLGIAAALAVVVTLAIYLLPILAGKGPPTALYVKNNELFTTRLAKLQPWQVTSKLVDGKLSGMNKDAYADLLSDYTYLTKNGKILFYPDGYAPDDAGVSIFYRNIKNPEEEAHKLDSDIFQYTVSPDGSRAVYLKTDGTLYRHNMQEKVKIASDITTNYSEPLFYTSEDCKNIIYIVENKYSGYTIYSQDANDNKLKLASDCYRLHYVTSDCTTIYYSNFNGTLYKATMGEDKVKLAYNVSRVFAVYDTGEIYYATYDPDEPPSKITVSQFVEDDVPTDTSRDALRQELASTSLYSESANALCYYDGNASHNLVENCFFTVGSDSNSSTISYTFALDAPTLVISYCNIPKTEKVKLSQVATLYDILARVKENTQKASRICVAVKGTITELPYLGDEITAQDICLTKDGKTAYYLANGSDTEAGDLYKFAITDGKPQTSELYDTDVNNFAILDNKTVLYYCDVNKEKQTADLYVNQLLVDYDTEYGFFYYNTDNQQLLFFTDMDKDYISGTLKLWEDNELIRISDDVYTFECVGNEILYITEYDTGKGEGTLYLFKNDESQKVDTKVSYIIDSTDQFGFVFRKISYMY